MVVCTDSENWLTEIFVNSNYLLLYLLILVVAIYDCTVQNSSSILNSFDLTVQSSSFCKQT